MKKITFLLFFITSFVFAQVFQNENFDALTVGNASGQGGLNVFDSASGDGSEFQIFNEGGTQGNILQITGSAAAGVQKFVWLNGFSTDWNAAKTSGNNIVEIEYEFYTGSTATSISSGGIRLFDSSFNTLAGLSFDPVSKDIIGLARLDDMGTPSLSGFNLGAGGTAITLDENTWYKVGFAFNYTTGQVIWKGPGFYSGVSGTDANIDPIEVDFLVLSFTGNTSSFDYKFDSFRVRATATENLLGVNDTDNTLSESVKLYPNPATDIINLAVADRLDLTKLEIVDLNGKIIKSIAIKNLTKKQINISELNNGLYIINIYSIDGMITKKIIKQ
ncbi:MAG: T9SS type A sorting domain-containing protein [Flavobacteriaceae bacterium]|tara:strand:+ start:1685 stop:2680 length:996 start_codon:yes stop_codon:yes gene_type:complete